MQADRQHEQAAATLDLGKARERLEVEAAREQTSPFCLTSRQCLYLVEIAEAARDYFGQSLPYSGDPDADLAQENLRAALRHVTDPRYA